MNKTKSESISISAFARRLGISRPVVSRLCRSGVLKKNSKGELNYKENVKRYMDGRDPRYDHLSKSPLRRKLAASNPIPKAGTLAEGRLKNQQLKNKKLEIEVEQKEAELIPLRDALKEFDEVGRIVKNHMMKVPAQIVSLLMKSSIPLSKSPDEVRTILEDAVRDALDVLNRPILRRGGRQPIGQ